MVVTLEQLRPYELNSPTRQGQILELARGDLAALEGLWKQLPIPEVVLAVSSDGRIKGVMLGNDVNLRDFEGRSALLLSKANNNASTALGPLLRLFDESFSLDDVRNAEVDLRIEGEDGFILSGRSSMRQISRDPQDLVQPTLNENHQYPDGLVLFLGTLFAPKQDRDQPGNGFTHKPGDVVSISNAQLGTLCNRVTTSDLAPRWERDLPPRERGRQP
jgi:fumarylacetoacetate (FAA) hydrolase family protein